MEVQEEISTWKYLNDGDCNYCNDWFLMGSPVLPFMIVVAYLAFVLKIGPALMRGKRAYKLRKVLILYNALQVLYSGYVVYTGYRILKETGFRETTCTMDNKVHAQMLRAGIHIYLMGKFSELLDTIFFVLRKKWSQVTFLHVYHHSFMFAVTWCCLKYAPSHNVVFVGTVNSVVHIVMYTYYGLAAFPGLTKYLWWKKYITKMQLIQFTMIFINSAAQQYQSVCPTSYIMMSALYFNVVLFFYLFSKFYIQNYIENKKRRESAAKNSTKSKFETSIEENSHKLTEKVR